MGSDMGQEVIGRRTGSDPKRKSAAGLQQASRSNPEADALSRDSAKLMIRSIAVATDTFPSGLAQMWSQAARNKSSSPTCRDLIRSPDDALRRGETK